MIKVSVIAIPHKDHPTLFFHGKRKDNGKWSMPGGHGHEGETEKETASREAMEEIGVKPKNLHKLCDKEVKSRDGEKLCVTLFTGELDDTSKITFENDPDSEFESFKFLDPSTHDNMHIPDKRNILLDYLKQNKGSLSKSGPVKITNHNQKIRDIADSYARSNGLSLNHNAAPVHVDQGRATNIAQAYHAMPHNPQDPETKKAYSSLISETTNQFLHLKNSGFKTSKVPAGSKQPYANSKDMLDDVKNNNHLWYFPTDSGFGPEGSASSDHPLLQNVKVGNEEMPANDMFRIVHDVFGHAKEGHSFGPHGEENAWNHHMQMYSPEAQKALTSETRGQNSWVNFGPEGEANRANPGNTTYADQKAGLLPNWAMDVNTTKKSEWKDKIRGGLSDKKKPSDFDQESLKEGLKVELEHSSDPRIATEIAMDHLAEDPHYYKKLKTIEKSYLEKRSKNVREQIKRVHGNWKTKAGSPGRDKQMNALDALSQKRYGLKTEQSKGKLSSTGKMIDKPTFDNEKGRVQHIGNPDSLTHELAHVERAKSEVGLKEFQEQMDKVWGEANPKYGYKQQARLKDEYETTALENKLRRRAGLPAHQKEVVPKERKEKRKFDVDDPGKKIIQEIPPRGRAGLKWLTGTSSNVSPEAAERVDQIDSGEIKFDKDKGWHESQSIDAKINRRDRYFRSKLKISPEVPTVKKTEQSEADKESDTIKENKKKPENQRNHKFKAATWTHSNGHPRCLNCGDEQLSRGLCHPGQNLGKGAQTNRPFGKSENKPINLIHYGHTSGLKELDPAMMGTSSVKSAESKYGKPDVNRNYYYREGSAPESIVTSGAKAKYHAQLSPGQSLYDIGQDLDGIYGKLKESSKNNEVNPGMVSNDSYLQAVKDAGHHGFFNSKSALPGAVGLFHKHPVMEDQSFNKAQIVQSKPYPKPTIGPAPEFESLFDYNTDFTSQDQVDKKPSLPGFDDVDENEFHIGQEPEGVNPLDQLNEKPKHSSYFGGLLGKLPKVTGMGYFKGKLKAK